jgi:hypothetical protein
MTASPATLTPELDDDANYIIKQLNDGLRLEWAYIDELNRSIDQMLERAQKSGGSFIPASEKSRWAVAFESLRENLQAVRNFDAASRESFKTHDHASNLDPWESILDQVGKLHPQLDAIQSIGSTYLPEPSQNQWKDLVTSISLQLDTLRSHVVTVRFKLELREKYGGEHAESITEDLVGRLPILGMPGGEDRDALVRLERDKMGGTWDALKALLLLPEETKK